uniref:Uncharacterized protein n=1 Tax=Ditylenchus dipsaci TaxID=166011 RepID=A0A915DGT6_9BILA
MSASLEQTSDPCSVRHYPTFKRFVYDSQSKLLPLQYEDAFKTGGIAFLQYQNKSRRTVAITNLKLNNEKYDGKGVEVQLLESFLNFQREQGVRSVIARLQVPVQQSVLFGYFGVCGFRTGLPEYLQTEKPSFLNLFKRIRYNKDVKDAQRSLHIVLNKANPNNEKAPYFENKEEIKCVRNPKKPVDVV